MTTLRNFELISKEFKRTQSVLWSRAVPHERRAYRRNDTAGMKRLQLACHNSFKSAPQKQRMILKINATIPYQGTSAERGVGLILIVCLAYVVSVRSSGCAIVSLCHCTTVTVSLPLCHCATVTLALCHVSLCHCATVSMCHCVILPLCQCHCIPLSLCHCATV